MPLLIKPAKDGGWDVIDEPSGLPLTWDPFTTEEEARAWLSIYEADAPAAWDEREPYRPRARPGDPHIARKYHGAGGLAARMIRDLTNLRLWRHVTRARKRRAAMAHEHCHGNREGDCGWTHCPQLREGEPQRSGRHCPLDTRDPETGECTAACGTYRISPTPA